VGWLDELSSWLATTEGLTACAAVHIRPDRVLAAAVVLAAHADHGTGRNCGVTNATVGRAAGCSPRTVTTARQILNTAGLALEVYRGTATAAGRRASVWHLISRPTSADNTPAREPLCALPPSRRDRRSSHVGSNSPSGRQRALRNSALPHQKKSRNARCTPRPLHVQQLAAGIVAGSLGLDRGHIGRICDALSGSGLQLQAWTTTQLLTALNADMRARRSSWPDQISNPAAFLASRLQHLPQLPPGARAGRGGPGQPGTQRVKAQDATDLARAAVVRADTERWYIQVVAATTPQERDALLGAHDMKFGAVANPMAALAGAGRRSAMRFPQAPLAVALARWVAEVVAGNAGGPNAGPQRVSVTTEPSGSVTQHAGAGGCVCISCGEGSARRRAELPLEEFSSVCDRCWPAVAAELAGSDQEEGE